MATAFAPQTSVPSVATSNEALRSGVSWPAVFAGATVTAAFGLVLLLLGVGFELSAMSPWSSASTATVSASAIAWVIAVQAVSSALGGYLAGRLRTKWTQVHSDEVYFRDTAHGLLSWALAVVVAGAFLASAATAMSRGGGEEASRTGEPSASTAWEAYYVDALFRPAVSTASADVVSEPTRVETGRILANVIRKRDSATADKAYLSQIVAAHTGLGSSDAARRVDDVVTRVQGDLDALRRGGARASLWSFLALLIGAFCASLAATIGGRQRDQAPSVHTAASKE